MLMGKGIAPHLQKGGRLMRKLSLLLAITMMFTMTLSTVASAETSAAESVTVS